MLPANLAEVRLLEELSMTALPALQTVYYDGWVLRFAAGHTRRANAIYPLYDSLLDIDHKIRRCETYYDQCRQPTIFKMTPLTYPAELDSILEQRGYRNDSGASIQTLSLDHLEASPETGVVLSTVLTDEWLQAYFRLNAVPDRHYPTMRQMLSSVFPLMGCATLYHQGHLAAAGLGVVDQGFVGLFDIVVAPEHRRKGLGRQLVLALLNWGKQHGAAQAYLQVVPTNMPAINLYAALDFREVYQYRYRTK